MSDQDKKQGGWEWEFPPKRETQVSLFANGSVQAVSFSLQEPLANQGESKGQKPYSPCSPMAWVGPRVGGCVGWASYRLGHPVAPTATCVSQRMWRRVTGPGCTTCGAQGGSWVGVGGEPSLPPLPPLFTDLQPPAEDSCGTVFLHCMWHKVPTWPDATYSTSGRTMPVHAAMHVAARISPVLPKVRAYGIGPTQRRAPHAAEKQK